MRLSCVEACSERACKTGALAGSSDQAYLSAASWSLVWAVAISSRAEIIGNADSNTESLPGADEHFTSSVELARAELIINSYCSSRFYVLDDGCSNFQGFSEAGAMGPSN
jgi:hypothetical protein